jgi:hypothetical protein
MKGQTRVEFIFGIILFCVLIFFIVSQINTVFSSIINDYNTNNVKAEAESVIGILSNYKGYPENWNAASHPQTLGLLDSSSRYLSNTKIDALNMSCDMMDNLTSNYRLQIYNTSGLILFCGSETLKPPKVIVSKKVLIGLSLGNITLELW